MLRYVLRRILLLIPVVIGVTVIIFSLMYMIPGDPTQAILGSNAEPWEYEELREKMGLNDPYIVTFEKVDANYSGTKLLGYPSNYVDEYDDKPGLLLQYDPLDFDVPFLSTCDGYAFVFFGKTNKTKFSHATYEVVSS